MKRTMPLPAYIKNAIRMLNEAGYEAYVVGGAVRSWLLGTEIHDYDLTTSATPEEMKQVFNEFKIIETGIRHGTVTIIFLRKPVEITTYRTETGYSDHRHPDQVSFTRSLKEDTARRDFTINALCYHPKQGIIDYFGGVQDLQNFLIRTVGNPSDRFQEDALRICRAVRFASQLGFRVEEETEKSLLQLTPTISLVSQERITAELIKTVSAPYFKVVLKEFRPVFEQIIPELQEYQEPQWSGIYMNLSLCPSSDSSLRMAILLDPLNDSERSDEILRRLKFSNSDREAVLSFLKNRNIPLSDRIDIRKAMNRVSVPFLLYLDFRCARDSRLSKTELLRHYQAVIRDDDCYTLKQLDVSGKDLQNLGLKGSAISVGMHTLLNAVMENKVSNQRDALISYLRSLSS